MQNDIPNKAVITIECLMGDPVILVLWAFLHIILLGNLICLIYLYGIDKYSINYFMWLLWKIGFYGYSPYFNKQERIKIILSLSIGNVILNAPIALTVTANALLP